MSGHNSDNPGDMNTHEGDGDMAKGSVSLTTSEGGADNHTHEVEITREMIEMVMSKNNEREDNDERSQEEKKTSSERGKKEAVIILSKALPNGG